MPRCWVHNSWNSPEWSQAAGIRGERRRRHGGGARACLDLMAVLLHAGGEGEFVTLAEITGEEPFASGCSSR